ncbi:putative S-layer protein [Candidatus Woesearchaeota archaeon]|jgi:hypothetical protein|nr:putative S-layer protein [Candidatus Woesearchaeota archaeon]MBT4208022.1 putative S-layer protein [Candidatus Woesearchaeota archaeon]MBT4730669.1 putative S-layer protein [Candidatus Woesearchaeota archaeon]MBT4783198.1 putative S-layer protein [Candidatus Woesearchaeota archaeon]MBT5111547.1 putative S-layer protein [Candidatus Woesearchaeota archaeon]
MLQKIKFMFLWILVLAVIPAVNANIAGLTLDSTNASVDLLQNDVSSFDIIFTNSDTDNITINFSHLEMLDDDNEQLELTFPTNFTIHANSNATLTIDVEADNKLDLGSYSSTLTFTDINSLQIETFSFTSTVEPGFCDFGRVGTSLLIDIKDPDTGDDYSPGDVIDIEVDVDNLGTADLNVQVEAFLYSDNIIIESASSATENIRDGKDETFYMTLKIPTDNDDIDENKDYELYIIAYDDDNDDEECTQADININIELEKHQITLEDTTRFISSSTQCGSEVSLIVDVINTGDKDEDVMIVVENSELGIYETSDTFELEDFNSDDDNQASRTFNFEIPSNIQEEVYNFVVNAVYSGNSEKITLPLDVWSCEYVDTTSPDYSQASLYFKSEKLISTTEGKANTVHLVLENNAPTTQIYFITLEEVSDFAETTSKTVTLEAGQSTNVFLPLEILSDAEEGTYTAMVQLTDGSDILASETLTVSVGVEESKDSVSLFSETTPKDLVIYNVILFLIVVLIIVLLRYI